MAFHVQRMTELKKKTIIVNAVMMLEEQTKAAAKTSALITMEIDNQKTRR